MCIRDSFYTCLIAKPGFGKSAALNEVQRFLPTGFKTAISVDSGPALVNLFHDLGENETGPIRVLLHPDEIRDIFEKAKVVTNSKNSLFTEYITLYRQNSTESRTVGRGSQEVTNAHLAILGGVQPDVYEGLWTNTGGGSSGLQSRFILAAVESNPIPAVQSAWDHNKAAEISKRIYEQVERAPRGIRITEEASSLFHTWWGSIDQTKPPTTRISDIVKQFLVVLAVTNDTGTIGPELMGVGIEFGKYEINLRERFNPLDSYTWQQEVCDKIEALIKRHGPMTVSYTHLTLPTICSV